MQGKEQQREKLRARKKERRVLDSMLMRKGLALLMNFTVGQSLRSLMTENPLEAKTS
jgi:hypothetical protein